MAIGRVNTGGGSGATLVVSSPDNVSVTVSKDDKSYTKNCGSLGFTTFKGLATGTWTVTISGNGQTATKTIEITADYAITIAFFAATINVTYPSGSTCAITTDLTNYSDIIFAGDKSGYWSFTVPYTGTWYVTCFTGDITNPDQIAYKAVSITADGQIESVTLSYWNGELYYKGDEFPDVTGGWTGTNPSSYYNTGTVTKNADNIKVSITSKQQIFVSTVNKISLTNVNTIYAKIVSASNPNASRVTTVFAVGTAISSSYAASRGIDNGQSGYVSIDVSNLTGEYYVYFHIASETNSAQITFDEVYME